MKLEIKTKNLLKLEQIFLAEATGFEPAISALTGPHVSRYTTPPNEGKFIIRPYRRQGKPSVNLWPLELYL